MAESLGFIGEFVENHGAITIALEVALLLFIRHFVVAIPKKTAEVISDPRKAEIARSKYGESLWFFIYYTAVFVTTIAYLWDKEWLWNPRAYWLESSLDPPPFPCVTMSLSILASNTYTYLLCYFMRTKSFAQLWASAAMENAFFSLCFGYPEKEKLGLRMIYTTQTAYYISASIVVLFFTNARGNHKDRYVMLIHHAVTIALLAVSYALNEHRIGSVVLILHDVSDIFLEGAKLCRYAGLDSLTNSAFATFALVFFVSRLVIYPLRILYAIYRWYPMTLAWNVYSCTGLLDSGCQPELVFRFPLAIWWFGLLGTLQILHIYWFALIARMIVRAISTNHIEKDIRSDEEDEDFEPEPEPTKKKNGVKAKHD